MKIMEVHLNNDGGAGAERASCGRRWTNRDYNYGSLSQYAENVIQGELHKLPHIKCPICFKLHKIKLKKVKITKKLKEIDL